MATGSVSLGPGSAQRVLTVFQGICTKALISCLESTIEDSFNGVTAAKRAGLLCIAVPNEMTGDMDFDQADVLLGSLAEMSLEGYRPLAPKTILPAMSQV